MKTISPPICWFHNALRLGMACFLLTCPSNVALAQYGAFDSQSLTATGTKDVSLNPSVLQMAVQVEGRSSDLPAAVKELKRRVDVAKGRLAELKAIEDSIEVSKPSLQGAANPQEQRQLQQLASQYGGGEKGKEMIEKTLSVSITQTITARWRLDEDDDLQRLLIAKELTDKIKKVDVGSSEDKQPLSEAQEELAEEMKAMMDEYSYNEPSSETGTPVFTFVAILSGEEYEAAVAEAYEDAKSQIESLAKATGARIEAPKPVAVNFAGNQGANYGYMRGPGIGSPERQESGDFETPAASPAEAKCKVSVAAAAKHKS